ncbi:TauD/TfdA family dioxygenase [Nocardioides sp. CBS4Y-1]|uniref:TauD/TfdA family dioxygenase n=2 Tax=Nocardioides acrostichi TaxID=2784339 RepID=A0A930Y5V2_9ACTN|nr:TauD/TfdA family dioxygenase [Nocardioides acrostichi]
MGLRVESLSPAQADLVKDALADHGVVVFPGQTVGDEAFLAFLTSLGEPVFTVGETPVPGWPDLNVISNVGRDRPPRSAWHVDTSYVDSPPAYTALRAVSVPAQGGATLFSDQYAALDTLAPDLRAAVEGRTATHVVTGVDPGPGEQRSAEHPLVRPHPRTGRPALYLTSPARMARVEGLSDDEAADLVVRLHEHSTASERVLEHSWEQGDVVVWDNACVMHRADHSAVVGDRVMHRGMVR